LAGRTTGRAAGEQLTGGGEWTTYGDRGIVSSALRAAANVRERGKVCVDFRGNCGRADFRGNCGRAEYD